MTKFIAHRGFSYLETENTIEAFKKALESDFFGIELDIHLTKDKKIIVHHDDDTSRLGNVNYTIKEKKYDELKQVKIKDINTGLYTKEIPLLEDVLNLVKNYNKHSIVEIKPQLNIEDLKLINNMLINFKNITVISFHLDNLINIRKINKEIPLEFLTSYLKEEELKLCQKNNINLDLNYNLVTEENFKMLKEKKFTINCWTVNNLDDAKRLFKLGVDYITTDKINKL